MRNVILSALELIRNKQDQYFYKIVAYTHSKGEDFLREI